MSYNLDEGVIRNCVIVGINSLNGRTYLPMTLRSTVKEYEGAPVYLGHIDNDAVKRGVTRNPDDWVGTVRNVHFMSGVGLIADFHFETRIDLVKDTFAYAKERREAIGFSHCIEGVKDAKQDTIVKIYKVFSVDLVSNPASGYCIVSYIN